MSGEQRSSRLADRIVALAHSPWILPAPFAVEVAETTFLPIPYEAIFIALCLAARERIWLFTAVTVLGSAVAGAIMYTLGAYFAAPASGWLGIGEALDGYRGQFAERGPALIFLGGITPAPSYLINFAAGANGYPFATFVALFAASRFVRFAILGGLLWLFGDRIVEGWEKLPLRLRRALWIVLLGGVVVWFVTGL